MKIFLVGNTRKMNKISKILENNEIESIEIKENCKFRMTKNDYTILSDEYELADIDKLKNIIILVNRKDYKYIWKLSDTYKTLDIIDAYMNDEYIVERIKKVIRRKQ